MIWETSQGNASRRRSTKTSCSTVRRGSGPAQRARHRPASFKRSSRRYVLCRNRQSWMRGFTVMICLIRRDSAPRHSWNQRFIRYAAIFAERDFGVPLACCKNCVNWVRGCRSPMDKRRVAIIGSGFGGLAAAIRLQAIGFETIVYEKRDLPGGRAYVYHDNGFTFDAGPTVITAPHCLRELFVTAGKSMEDYVELLEVKPFYRLFWEDGYQFDYSNDLAKLETQIAWKSLPDVQGYRRFLRYSEDVF